MLKWSSTDWIAAIGAAAWAPQIVGWIWKMASRPTLRVRAGGTIQVGHGGLGGLIGLNVGISTERKDALIDSVRAIVTHERGDQREFSWMMATENQTEMMNDSGERLQWSRTQTVLALKVTTQLFVERFFGFGIESEQGAILATQNVARNVYAAQRANGVVEWTAFLRDPAAEAVRLELENMFHWQAGHYRLELVCSIVGGGTHVERFEFNLARQDVEHIRENLGRWGENLSVVIGGGAWPRWNASFPTLVRR